MRRFIATIGLVALAGTTAACLPGAPPPRESARSSITPFERDLGVRPPGSYQASFVITNKSPSPWQYEPRLFGTDAFVAGHTCNRVLASGATCTVTVRIKVPAGSPSSIFSARLESWPVGDTNGASLGLAILTVRNF
jgi:hypothetical protein